MNIREISEALEINRNSVAKYLDVLTTREEVEFKLFGKSKVYFLSQHVPVSTLIRFSSNLMVIINRDLQIVQITDAFLCYLGMARESVIGTPINEVHTDLLINDSVQAWCRESLLGNETAGEICIMGDGPRQYFRVVSTPTRFPDNTRGVIIFYENITERIQAADLLRKSEEKYRRFIETANEGICAVDRNFHITFANQKIADILGYPVEWVIGKHITRSMHPDDQEDIQRKMQNRLEGKKEDYERRFIKKDGSICWLLVSVTPLMTTDGTFDGSFAMMTDITERRQAEDVLRESEERFRHLIDYVPGLAVQGYYLDGTTFYWNKASERLYGYTADEAIGRNLVDLIIPQEMQEGVKNAIAEMAVSCQPVPSADLRLMRKDKSRVEVFSGHAIVQIAGKPPQLFCMDIDLTRRNQAEQAIRESEERFRQVADNSNEWIWEMDTEGTYTYCSAVVEQILGYTPVEIVGKMHYYDLFPEASREELRKITFAGIGRCEPFSRFINPAVHKNGSIIILETSGTPVFDSTGRFAGYRGCDTDVTERRNMENERKTALEQIEKNIAQFAMLGDEIRNPLTVILAQSSQMVPAMEEKITLQVKEIDRILNRIDQGWIESERVRSFLRKYYDISLPEKKVHSRHIPAGIDPERTNES
ncbi:MAG: PAS domain S-box protein [Methanoregula sp.]|jgi:PAS domain S-box-containing protein|nr:PAS domain S-box protein [Methanoregula sp.]